MEKKKILVIDDEESLAQMIKLNLERKDKRYEVRVETSGSQAYSVARRYQPDLILLDVVMPDQSGSEVARQLRDDKDTERIPIVFLTATVLKNEAKNAGGIIGGNVFLAKPVNTEELATCVEKYMK